MKGRKTGGRRKGSKNRTSLEIREALIEILNNNLARLQTAIENMEDKEAGRLLVSLAKHLTHPEVSPEKLSEEQLTQILKYLKDEKAKIEREN
jgi:hypothetical protein